MKYRFHRLGLLIHFLVLIVTCEIAILAQAPAETKKSDTAQNAQFVKEAEYNWKRAKKWTLDYIDAMPEEAISFKPVPEVRSFADQMLHLAFWNYGVLEGATGKPNPFGKDQGVIEKRNDLKTKTALRKTVEESYDFVLAALTGMDDAKLREPVPFFGNKVSRLFAFTAALDHQTHHRAQTTIYLRLKGVKPPPEP